MPQRYPKVSIIGAGVVGSTLAKALFEIGYRFVSIIDKKGPSAISLARTVNCKKAGIQISDLSSETEIVLLTVSDDAIAKVAAELSKVNMLRFKNLFALHCSGVHSADVLLPLKKKDSLVAAIHPIQTFPASHQINKLKAKLKGIYYGIDGEPAAIKKAKQLVQDLGGKSVIIPSEMKPLYHAACVFASNYMTMFLNTIGELSKTLRIESSWTEVFGPLMATTMENVVGGSPADAITGPIVRGDISTIEIHLETLLRHAPQFLPLYTIGGIELARIAKDNGRISQENFQELIILFRKFIRSNSFNKIFKEKK